MKKIMLAAMVLGGLFALSGSASAQGWGHHGSHGHYGGHGAYHDDLEHRAFHRELDHREAHRYPLTWRQHERLHDALDHDAFHDQLEHRAYHRQNYSRPYYGGYGPVYGNGYWPGGFRSRYSVGPRYSFSFGW